jgi:thermitase
MSLVCLFALIAFDRPAYSEEIILESESPVFLDPDPEPEYPLSSLPEDAIPFTPSLPEDFVVGEMLVKFKEHVRPDNPGLDDLKNEVAAEYIHTHDRINVHLFRAKNAKDKEATLKTVEKFRRHPLVEYAEPNGIVQATYLPNDFYLQIMPNIYAIRAPEAWDLYNPLTPGVAIAVLDTGLDYNHPDINGKVLFAREKSGNCINPGVLPWDDSTTSHGTHVAGIAAATGNNTIGIAGVAYKDYIVPIKVLYSNSYGSWDSLACGVNIAAPIAKARIINMSIGGEGGSQTLYDAIYKAWANYGKIVVVAQGNTGEGYSYSFPACYSLNGIVISVGATDKDKNYVSFSLANECVTVSAPGTEIGTDGILSTVYWSNQHTYNYFEV